jgi:hypothetical protein
METLQIPTTNTEFVSFLDLLMKEILGDTLVLEQGESKDAPLAIYMENEDINQMHFNLRITTDSLSESILEKRIAEAMTTIGIECVRKDNIIYNLMKGEKRVGKFNIDIHGGSRADTLLLTFSQLDFN